MEAITKSRNAVMLLAVAAAAYGLGTLFGVVAFATYSDLARDYHTFRNWSHAADWFHFLGALTALAAVGVTAWDNLRFKQTAQLVELGVAVVATLIITVAELVNAASTSAASGAAVTRAVGIGLWALLVLSRAARYNLASQQHPGAADLLAQLWLMAAGGVLLFAIGSGFSPTVTDRGTGIAAGLIGAAGLILIAMALVRARSRGLMRTRPVETVVIGLIVLAASGLGDAIVAGIVFTPHATLKGLRIGVSIAEFVALAGIAILAFAAWQRLAELHAAMPATGIGSPPTWSPGSPPPPGAIYGPAAPWSGPPAPPPPTESPTPTTTATTTTATATPTPPSAAPPGAPPPPPAHPFSPPPPPPPPPGP